MNFLSQKIGFNVFSFAQNVYHVLEICGLCSCVILAIVLNAQDRFWKIPKVARFDLR